MYQLKVDVGGPLFDGRVEKHKDEFLREAVWAIAKEGRGDLGVQFIKVFKEPTGYYESRVKARPISDVHIGPAAVIQDSGVVYGPWLEGVGSRNYPVTRFRGYFSFMIVSDRLELKASSIAERVLPEFLRRMNGGV